MTIYDDEPHIDALSIVYHLSGINPPPPIAIINAIGISGDSAISMAAMVDVITVHEHRFLSAMMTKRSDVSPITSSLLILVDNTANTRLSLASIHPMEAVIAAIAVADGGLAALPQFLSTIFDISYIRTYAGRFLIIHHNMAWSNTIYTLHNNQMGVGVRFVHGDDGVGAFN